MSPLRLGAIGLVLLIPAASVPAAEAPKAPTEEQVENAVAGGLRWLAAQQQADGRWIFDNHQEDMASAATAFALLALLRAKDTPTGRPNVRALDQGLAYLCRIQGPEGDLGRPLQAHAVATLALCEVYARTGDPSVKRSAQRAINYIVFSQGPDGGWRYTPRQPGDLESTGWQVLALTTGERLGLIVPVATWREADLFLDSATTADGGYSYIPKIGPTPTMTVVGLFCRHCRGWKPDDPRLEKGIALFKQHPPEVTKRSGVFYSYFATLLMNQRGTEAEKWNAQMRGSLLEQQEKTTEGQVGSWLSPTWTQLGRPFATPLAILMLRVTDRVDRPPPLPARELKAAEIEALWAELKGSQVFQAAEASRRLGAGAEQAVPFLMRQLQPAKVDGDQIARLIDALDHDRFAVRQQAEHDLIEIGELAELALREAVDKKPALEVKTRLERVLARLPESSFQGIPALRAITALEYANTSAARELLERLAKGEAGASTTKAASAALRRLAKRERWAR